MGIDREEWIERRAYELWELAGRPDGQDHEHWSQAKGEWETRSGEGQPSRLGYGDTRWDDEAE